MSRYNQFPDLLKVGNELLKIPSKEDIRITEEQLTFKLPTSYLDFVRKFGWCVLCDLFIISVPSSVYNPIDLIRINNDEKKIMMDDFELGYWNATELTKEKLENLFVLGHSLNGDQLCWDLENKSEYGEFPIWFFGDENEVIGKVADDLYDFVNDFCIGQKIDEYYPPGVDKKWKLPSTFKPLR